MVIGGHWDAISIGGYTGPDLPIHDTAMPSSLSTPGYGVRSGALMGWRPLVESLGGEPLALLRDHGLSPDLLGDPDAIMPVARFAALLGGCARHLRCPDFGLRMANGQGMAMLGALGKLIQDSPGPEAGLAVLQRHIALHNQGEYWSSQVTAGRLYVYRFELFDDDLDRRVYRELSVGACLRLCAMPVRLPSRHRASLAPRRASHNAAPAFRPLRGAALLLLLPPATTTTNYCYYYCRCDYY